MYDINFFENTCHDVRSFSQPGCNLMSCHVMSCHLVLESMSVAVVDTVVTSVQLSYVCAYEGAYYAYYVLKSTYM